MSVLKQMKGLVKHLGREERTDASLHVSKLEWLIDRAEAADTAQAVIDELVDALRKISAYDLYDCSAVEDVNFHDQAKLMYEIAEQALQRAKEWK